MADCECLPKCPFFNDRMENMPAMADLMKKRFCQGNWSSCARYMVFKGKGREFVPSDMFPSETERAEEILG
jgi:hypothetical protein